MNNGIVAMRYARAILSYAMERKTEDAVYENMQRLAAVAGEVRDLIPALQNPALSLNAKVTLLCNAVDASPDFVKFATLVLKHEREELLHNIANCYIMCYRKAKNIVAAKITTAVELSDVLKEKISLMIAKRESAQVELENIVDSSIIGGFIYEVDFVRYDASIKGRLRKIEKQMVERNKRII